MCVPVLPQPEKRYTEGATGHQRSSLEYTSSFPEEPTPTQDLREEGIM